MAMTSAQYKIGYVDLAAWFGPGHRMCEAPRHQGQGRSASVVIALAELDENGEPDQDRSMVWGACAECQRMIGQDIPGDWELPGPYLHEGWDQ